MTSIQDAMTQALEHPVEYHPQRPAPLAKKIYQQSDVSESWLWSAIGLCTGLAVAIIAYNRSRGN